jgi:hypothetical protein
MQRLHIWKPQGQVQQKIGLSPQQLQQYSFALRLPLVFFSSDTATRIS